MLRIILVILTAYFLATGPSQTSKPQPTQNPFWASTACEDNIPPPCPPDCGC